jgi:hypothetical protein
VHVLQTRCAQFAPLGESKCAGSARALVGLHSRDRRHSTRRDDRQCLDQTVQAHIESGFRPDMCKSYPGQKPRVRIVSDCPGCRDGLCQNQRAPAMTGSYCPDHRYAQCRNRKPLGLTEPACRQGTYISCLGRRAPERSALGSRWGKYKLFLGRRALARIAPAVRQLPCLRARAGEDLPVPQVGQASDFLSSRPLPMVASHYHLAGCAERTLRSHPQLAPLL